MSPSPATAAPTRTGPGRLARAEWRVLAVAAVVCWLLGGFWSAVRDRSPAHAYPSPVAGQPWIGAGGTWPRGFFLLSVPLAGMPTSATLWIDADQTATVFVDGQRVDNPNAGAPTRFVDINPARTHQVQGFDLLPALVVGTNDVGLDVVDFDGRPAAFRARLILTYGVRTESLGIVPSDWRATTDVGLTAQPVPNAGEFSAPGFAAVGWHSAVTAAPRTAGLGLTMPPAAFEDPLDGQGLGGVGHQLVVATTVSVPSGCTSGYVRVGAAGAWSLAVDGQVVATGPGGYAAFGYPAGPLDQPHEIRTVAVDLVDLCSLVGAGHHTLTAQVDASANPSIYVDGALTGPSGTTRFQTGSGWRLVGDDGAATGSLHPVPAASVAPTGALVLEALPAVALHHRGAHVVCSLLVAAAIGVVWALDALALRRRRRRGDPRTRLRRIIVGLTPATGLVVAASQVRHLVDVAPPFPSTPGVGLAVLVTAAGGTALALGWRRAPSPAGTPGPAPSDGPGAVPVAPAARGLRRWLLARPYGVAVVVFAAVWGAVTSDKITFQPVWQDELSTLGAAQGIRAHGIPQWPSGFQYWKSELYSAIIAGIGALCHDSIAVLRDVSVFWLAATIVIFGLVLVPLVLPGRRVVCFVATVVFATSPFEMAHARDLRMYQMEQFMVIVVAALLLRAIVVPSTRRIATVAVGIVTMYLTHEETFGVLVAIPVVLVGLLGLRWLRNWRWWVFGGAAVGVVGLQLALASFTRPLNFGQDQSNGPFVRWSPSPFYYLDQVFFTTKAHGATLGWVTLLALVALGVGVRRRQALRLYLAAFMVVPVLVVALILPATETRYGFLSFPFEFALAACALCDIAGWIGAALTRGVAPRTATRVLFGMAAAGTVVALMVSMLTSVGDYGPAVAEALGVSYSQGQADFGLTGAYVRDHLEPGDTIIAAASANVVAYGVGRVPDYWMPQHAGGRLLYVFEKDDEAVDTQYGIPTIETGDDLETVIDAHRRTWLLTTDDALASILPAELTLIRTRFTLVAESESTSVFLSTT